MKDHFSMKTLSPTALSMLKILSSSMTCSSFVRKNIIEVQANTRSQKALSQEIFYLVLKEGHRGSSSNGQAIEMPKPPLWASYCERSSGIQNLSVNKISPHQCLKTRGIPQRSFKIHPIDQGERAIHHAKQGIMSPEVHGRWLLAVWSSFALGHEERETSSRVHNLVRIPFCRHLIDIFSQHLFRIWSHYVGWYLHWESPGFNSSLTGRSCERGWYVASPEKAGGT
jgi:hypothetical protein